MCVLYVPIEFWEWNRASREVCETGKHEQSIDKTIKRRLSLLSVIDNIMVSFLS